MYGIHFGKDASHNPQNRGSIAVGAFSTHAAYFPALLAALFCVPFTASAQAQDLCAGLKQAVAEAAQNFATLKTSATPVGSVRNPRFPARNLLPGSTTCEITERRFGIAYKCERTPANSSKAAARSVFHRDVASIKKCFPDVKEEEEILGIAWQVEKDVTVKAGLMLLNAGSLDMPELAGLEMNSSEIEVSISKRGRLTALAAPQGAAGQDRAAPRRARLGVSLQSLTAALADHYTLPNSQGALVAAVDKGSAAEKAGIVPGDVILAFNDRIIGDATDLSREVARTVPSTAITLTVWRNKTRHSVRASLDEGTGCCRSATLELPAVQADIASYEDALVNFRQGNYAESLPILTKYAEQGRPDAQYSLGVAYAGGRGVPRDDAQAARWYRMAAEQGNASSQERLGLMYLDGKGVTRDEAEGEKWLRRAAEQGSQRAKTRLNELLARNSGLSQSQPANNPGNGEAKVESASSAGTARAASPPVDCSTVCTEAGGGRICSTPVGCTPNLPARSDAVNSAANGPASGQAPSTGLSLDNALDIAGTLLGITSAVQGVRRGGGTPAPAVVSPGSGARPSANYCEDMLRRANQCKSNLGGMASMDGGGGNCGTAYPGAIGDGTLCRVRVSREVCQTLNAGGYNQVQGQCYFRNPRAAKSAPAGQAGGFQACYDNYMNARRAAGCP